MTNRRLILNSTLADLRGRVDTLAKSVFLIAGGSVTLSVNLFLQKKELLNNVIFYLKCSWILSLTSIALFALVIGLLILQGFINSERSRKTIEKNKKSADQPTRYFDYIAVGTGVIGFIVFLSGMVYLVLAALYL